VLLLAPLVLTTDFIDLPGALVHSIGMICSMGAAAVLLWLVSPRSGATVYASVAFASGAAAQFFGDLTNPDAGWALMVACAAVVAVGSNDIRQAVHRVVSTALAWIVGFAWIWFSKWVIAAIVIGYDTVRYVVTYQAEERLGGEVDGVDPSLLSGLSASWRLWRVQPLTTLALTSLGIAAIVLLVRRRSFRSSWRQRVLLASAAVIPLVWHLAMRNHTAVHYWFTYRSLAIAYGIVLMAATARLGGEPPARSGTDVPTRTRDQAQYGSVASGSMS
jgi:hypothetical protein